jgi:uncharacterized YccA/Bax inhibitor family protein
MTINGTVNKSAFLIMLTMISASFIWTQYGRPVLDASGVAVGFPVAAGLGMGGALVGFVLVLISMFRMPWAPYIAPAYAVAEGLALGYFSLQTEFYMPGLAMQATLLTFATLGGLLLAYRAGLIVVTDRFTAIARTGMMAVAITYLIQFVMSLFGGPMIPYIHSSGVIGIGFSVLVIGIASMCLVMDFEFITTGERARAPAYMEWYAAMSLLITLVWLYMEILRLLRKLNSRD